MRISYQFQISRTPNSTDFPSDMSSTSMPYRTFTMASVAMQERRRRITRSWHFSCLLPIQIWNRPSLSCFCSSWVYALPWWEHLLSNASLMLFRHRTKGTVCSPRQGWCDQWLTLARRNSENFHSGVHERKIVSWCFTNCEKHSSNYVLFVRRNPHDEAPDQSTNDFFESSEQESFTQCNSLHVTRPS